MFQKVNSNSQLSGRIRKTNQDFQVDEIQQFTPSGSGEHVWLNIQKTGENTDWVAKQLAHIADVSRRDVSFAGMKDRNAVTTQWFSVQMPGREAPDWQAGLNQKGLSSVQVIEEYRHDRKLKRGALKGNQFKLTIRNFQGSLDELQESVSRIKKQGVPNYYGVQRFGHNGLNVEKAQKWLAGEFKVKDRNLRSIYLSAARSWVFNHILSERVKDGSWNQAIDGDVFILEGSNSSFSQEVDEEIIERLKRFDIHPSGALWGRGRIPSQDTVSEIETKIAHNFNDLCNGLEANGLKQERRALRLSVSDLNTEILDSEIIVLSFRLPQGAYATSVLTEIGEFV